MPSPSVRAPKLPREGGEKGKSDGKSSGSANAAVDWEDDGVWAAIATLSSVASLLGLQLGKGMVFDVSSLFDDAWDEIPELNLSSASDFDWSDKESLPGLEEVSDSEEESMFDSDSECSKLPDLESVSDSEDEWDNKDESAEEEDEDATCAAGPANVLNSSICAELYDSGCSQHLSPYCDEFQTYQEIPPKCFTTANNQDFMAVGQGEIWVNVPDGIDMSKMHLMKVLYSPEIGYTLISVSRLDQAGYTLTFGQGMCSIKDPDGNHIGSIPRSQKGLYRVFRDSGEKGMVNAVSPVKLIEAEPHCYLGHMSLTAARHLITHGFVTGLELHKSPSGDPFFCEACIYAKTKHQSVLKVHQGDGASTFGKEIHSDVWGPSRVETINGQKYFISFIDDCSCLTRIYLLRKKSESFSAYKNYEAWVKTHAKADIRSLHSNWGGEYLSKEFINHLENRGTESKRTVHDTPEENGVAERFNGIGLERTRALLHASRLPKILWGEALRHVVWLKNRTTTKALPDGKMPYEMLTGEKPDLSNVHEWGCVCYVHQATPNQSKLDPWAKEARWIGVDDESKGSRIYWPGEHRVTVERSVVFGKPEVVVQVDGVPNDTIVEELEGEDEEESVKSPPTLKNPPNTPVMPTQANDSDPEPPLTDQAQPESRRNLPHAAWPTQYKNWELHPVQPLRNAANLAVVDEVEEEVEGEVEYVMVADSSEALGLDPLSLAEVKRHLDWASWVEAIHEEIDTLVSAGTWRLSRSQREQML